MFIPNPDPVLYVGNPTLHPEIDWNWDNLTYGRYVLITKEEALASWPDVDIEQYWDKQRGGYVAGFDVFHTLHCLVSPSFVCHIPSPTLITANLEH